MSSVPKDVLDRALAAYDQRPDLTERARMRRALKASGAVFPGTEFMGAAESAEELGVRSPNLGKLQDLPAPFGRVRSGPFWVADVIRGVAKRRRESGITNGTPE